MNHNSSRGIWEWQIVQLIVLGALAVFSFFLWKEGFTEDGVRLVIRWSARISVTCFSIAFFGSAFHRLIQNSFSFWVYRNRKYWGISFAFLHLIHLLALGILQYNFHPVFEKAATTSLLAGFVAYLLLLLMLVTSFEQFSKYLSGKQWRFLHTFGGYWIWGVYFSSYFKGVIRGEYDDLIFVFMLLVVLSLRFWKLQNDQQKNDSLNMNSNLHG